MASGLGKWFAKLTRIMSAPFCPIIQMTAQDNKTEVLAEEIARYLADHPDASDTAEGIARWWLTRQRYEDALSQVQQAVERLVSQGRVQRKVLPDGTVVYGK